MSIRIAVDPTNPGQFFACCGLLELADRLWTGAEGWFDLGSRMFCLRPLGENQAPTAGQLIAKLKGCRLTNTMTEQQLHRLKELSDMKPKEREQTPGLKDEKKTLEKLWREEPILFHAPFHLRVDWFLDDRSGGNRFKTWAGQQSVFDIALAMKGLIEAGDWELIPPKDWLAHPAGGGSLPFNFDSDLGGQASALDVGFSFDPLGMRMQTRPLIELAAFAGLQRFRPGADLKDNCFRFCLWPTPLLPEVACAAACGALPVTGSQTFIFRLLYRTKYLKSFLPAQPIRGG